MYCFWTTVVIISSRTRRCSVLSAICGYTPIVYLSRSKAVKTDFLFIWRKPLRTEWFRSDICIRYFMAVCIMLYYKTDFYPDKPVDPMMRYLRWERVCTSWLDPTNDLLIHEDEILSKCLRFVHKTSAIVSLNSLRVRCS